jgi:hypothetical protein
MRLGPDEILVNLDIGVEDGLSGDRVEETIGRIDTIRAAVPEATRILVEVGPLP